MTIARVLLLAFMLAIAVRAEEYWVTYEGNDFPEHEGWTRFSRGGGALRSLEDGNLLLDSRQGEGVTDWYAWTSTVDPGPSEEFVLQWRMLVSLADPRYGVSLGVFSDESWAVGFEFNENSLTSAFESDVNIPFTVGEFHEFELRSHDMRSYLLTVDEAFAHAGTFVQVFTASEVSWGDGIVGGQSLSTWDYFRFGVVPEPATAMACAGGFLLLCNVRGRATT